MSVRRTPGDLGCLFAFLGTSAAMGPRLSTRAQPVKRRLVWRMWSVNHPLCQLKGSDAAGRFMSPWDPKHDHTMGVLVLPVHCFPALCSYYGLAHNQSLPRRDGHSSVSRMCIANITYWPIGGTWGHFKGANWLLALGPSCSPCCGCCSWFVAHVVLQLALSRT